MNEHAALVEWQWYDRTNVLGEKPVPVPLQPKIPYALTWDWNLGLNSERLVKFALKNTDGQDIRKLILFVIVMFFTGFGINGRSLHVP
jgi:hypothetical protein